MTTADMESAHTRVVRTRQTVGDGTVDLERFVLCSTLEATISLRDCAKCERGRSFVANPAAKAVSVVCSATVDGSDSVAPVITDGADRTAVSEIMAKNVTCVRENLSIAALDDLLTRLRVAGAPVVDDSFKPIGIVSRTDLVRTVGPRPVTDAKTVSDIMTPIAYCLPVNASVARAAALMVFEDIHRLPVVDTDGCVVGIVSTLDVLSWLARHQGFVIPPR